MNASVISRQISAALRTVTEREWVADALVFVSYLATMKLAQYILFSLHTSPALIWAPTGIALAAVLLKGDKMWVPVFAAYTVGLLTLPGYLPAVNRVIAIIGFTVQPLIGARIFKLMKSDGTIHRSRDVMVLLAGAAATAAVGPFFNTLGQVAFSALTDTTIITFSRAWAGGMLGIIVVTPFITGWYYSPSWPIRREQHAEAVAAFGLLLISTFLLFWTSFPSLVFLLIFLLCVSLFWIAIRFGSRINTSAILFVTILGIAGSLVARPTPTPLNTQLFADELFLMLIAPIFLQFFALMEERRRTERILAAKVKELEDITSKLSANDAAKNEFIAILAHELRNPLSTIVTTMELLRLEHPNAESVQLIGKAEQQTQSMRRLLDDLLDVARIAEKKFDIIRENVDLSSIVSRSIDATETVISERRHALDISLPRQSLPLYVDPVRMEQVVVNLLTNAAKYTPAGGKISLNAVANDSQLVVEVRDNGNGIPPERLEQIFSPFQQLNPAPHRSHGIGIGLFLTRQIVEMHGGTIEAKSSGPGAGSSFIVRLPLSNVAPAAPKAEPAVPAQRAAQRRRVLIVDDNEAAAIGMRKLLVHQGHDAREVHTGHAALAATESFAPDVVLLDIGLPDISGHDVARRIRTSGAPVKPVLIALTGYGQDEDRNMAIKSGFDLHLTKPVSITEVVEVLSTVSR